MKGVRGHRGKYKSATTRQIDAELLGTLERVT